MDEFDADWPVVGMVHLPALPGSPGFGSRQAVRERALADARALEAGGVDALMVENFGDAPFYPEDVPKHVVAEMATLARDLRREVDLPLGVNVLRNDAEAALSVAAAAGGSFVRVNVHVGARATDQGVVEGRAHETMRLRERLDTDVAVFTDVAVKHSAPVADRPLGEEFREVVERGLADAVVVSGPSTGEAAAEADLARAAELGAEAGVPVFVGSGVTRDTVETVVECADGAIVGTALKEDGETTNPVDEERVRALVDRVAELQ
ncbi:phosphorybosylanthranilate isomerase [Halobacteriales archaeon QS_1_68_20]|nr:MAG: phosphorybosylanthranilate isomerase [Halobacteriales archaeon QS_1_68_20]